MEMIIGGAYQGKEAYARQRHPEIVWTDGALAAEEELLSAQGVLRLEEYIKKELAEGRSLAGLAEKLWSKNPEVVLVSCEVGCGVVPVTPQERAYRETVGRVCTELAGHSSRVTRVICCIGTVIKDA